MFVIHLPPGYGGNITPFSVFPGESEILLPAYTLFQVQSVLNSPSGSGDYFTWKVDLFCLGYQPCYQIPITSIISKVNFEKLFDAAKNGNNDVFFAESIHLNKTNIDTLNDKSQTLLYCSSRNGHLSIVKWLIEHQASVNFMEYGSSPLHAATWYNRPSVVEVLLKAGARSDIKNKFGLTAVEEISSNEVLELYKKVLTQCWKGYWIQGSVKGKMVISLFWKGKEVSGEGTDLLGKFSFIGSLAPDGHISFLKQYCVNPLHFINYEGELSNENVMKGTWTLPNNEKGPFYLSRT
jgi:hypothetical protein